MSIQPLTRLDPPGRHATSRASLDDGVALYARAIRGRICDLPPSYLDAIARANTRAARRVLDPQLYTLVIQQLARA